MKADIFCFLILVVGIIALLPKESKNYTSTERYLCSVLSAIKLVLIYGKPMNE